MALDRLVDKIVGEPGGGGAGEPEEGERRRMRGVDGEVGRLRREGEALITLQEHLRVRADLLEQYGELSAKMAEIEPLMARNLDLLNKARSELEALGKPTR